MITTARLTLITVVAALSACHGHLSLRAPGPRDGAGSTRVAAYEQLRVRGSHVSYQLEGNTVSRSTSYLILGEGQRLRYPEDLIGVVSADSPTGRAASAAVVARGKKRAWATAAAVGVVVTAALVARAFAKEGDDFGPDTDWLVAGAGALVPTFIAAGVGILYDHREQEERMSAFSTYDDSLRARLNLCIDELRIVPCETLEQ